MILSIQLFPGKHRINEKLLESTGLKIEEITKKIKDILGTEYFKKYQNESI